MLRLQTYYGCWLSNSCHWQCTLCLSKMAQIYSFHKADKLRSSIVLFWTCYWHHFCYWSHTKVSASFYF